MTPSKIIYLTYVADYNNFFNEMNSKMPDYIIIYKNSNGMFLYGNCDTTTLFSDI